MEYAGAWEKLVNETNLKSKISWHSPFNPLATHYSRSNLCLCFQYLLYVSACVSIYMPVRIYAASVYATWVYGLTRPMLPVSTVSVYVYAVQWEWKTQFLAFRGEIDVIAADLTVRYKTNYLFINLSLFIFIFPVLFLSLHLLP
jgi:hypothetical protein